MTAICLKCGTKKSLPYEKCSKCDFDPQLNRDDLVKSVYLSSGRFDSESEKEHYDDVLNSYSKRLRSGLSVEYDQADIERLTMQLTEVEAFDDKSILNYMFRLLFPVILLVLFLIGVLLVLKQL